MIGVSSRTPKPKIIKNKSGSTKRERYEPGYAPGMAAIRITVDGKLALTVEQAAERYGYPSPSSMRTALVRLDIEPITYLDGRKPLYLATALTAAMRGRKGRGAPGVPRPHRAPEQT